MAGYPRVTHPSATKLTKSLPKLWQRLTPFDLHVLSTPPAFILSQDQTLIFSSLFVLPVLTGFRFLSCVSRHCSEFSLRIQFSVPVSRWNFQGCITVYLSRFLQAFCLSCCRLSLRRNSDIISCALSFVNSFFYFFKFIFWTFCRFSRPKDILSSVTIIVNRFFTFF